MFVFLEKRLQINSTHCTVKSFDDFPLPPPHTNTKTKKEEKKEEEEMTVVMRVMLSGSEWLNRYFF